MKSIYQDHLRPSGMLDALTSMADPRLTSVQIAVAYTSYGGVTALIPNLELAVTKSQWAKANKTLVTSFDMGITDPSALRYLEKEHGFAIRIANSSETQANYHPKMYMFGRKSETAVLIGSANLSARALAANTEIGVLIDPYPQPAELQVMWDAVEETSHKLTASELAVYEANRPKRDRRTRADAPVPPSQLPSAGSLPVFAQAVEQGLDPARYSSFWVEAGLVSGGARSQVELPRMANRFFGSKFDEYAQRSVTPIADLDLTVGANSWTRPLRWHGDNRMERVNLPTPRQSGLDYSGQLVRFKRTGQGFAVDVAPEGTALATGWIEGSRQLGTLFRIGSNGNRRCGLLDPRS